MLGAMTLAEAPRGTVSLVFTDVQGSTPLWEAAPEAMRESMALHNDVVRGAIAAHNGYEFRTEGDAFKVAFSSPVDALRFCDEVQSVLIDAPWPDELLAQPDASVVRAGDDVVLRGLRVRMGLHLGQPDVLPHPTTGRAEYDGPMVNATARIAALPAGGQVVASRVLWDAARLDARNLDLRAEELGRHRLKGLAAPVPLVQIDSSSLPSRQFPPLASRIVAESNLRPRDDTFRGREDKLAELADLLAGDARVITLVGPGGAGKTRLTIEAGHEELGRGRADVWFCDLTAARDAFAICEAVTGAVRVPLPADADEDAAKQFVGRTLSRMEDALLLLDNVEQTVDAVRACVGAWREAAPRCRFLLTSREPLGVAGEHVVPVESLPMEDAVTLFVDRAGRARPGFELADDEEVAVREIVERLDGLPLAIELAAARVDVLRPSAIATRLAERFRLLGRGGDERRGARATLRGTLDHSWELLSPVEQRALAQCTVFEDGFAIDAAEQVLDLGDADAWPMDVVQDLRRKSLLRTLSGYDVRLGLYESVRAYAAEKLDELGLREGVERRHSAYFTEAAERWSAGLLGDEGIACANRMFENAANALSVWDRERDRTPRLALRAFNAVNTVLAEGLRVASVEDGNQAVAIARGLGDDELLGETLRTRSDMLRISARSNEAARDAEEALELLKDSPPELVADVLRDVALAVSHVEGQAERAQELSRRAFELIPPDARFLRVKTLNSTSWVAMFSGRYDEAIAGFEEALALLGASESPLRGAIQTGLAFTLCQHGRPDEAWPLWEDGARTFIRAGDRSGHGTLAMAKAFNLARDGLEDEARALIEEARRAVAPLPAPGFHATTGLATALLELGLARRALDAGDVAGARARVEEARRRRDDEADRPAPGEPGRKLTELSPVLRSGLGAVDVVLAQTEALLPAE
jgi:predicted ATPase/class 3 adenylate cyclase